MKFPHRRRFLHLAAGAAALPFAPHMEGRKPIRPNRCASSSVLPPEPGTIDALVVSYYKSTDWTNLAEDTKEARRRIIEKFRLRHGGKHVHLLTEAHLVKIMNDIAAPTARRSWLKAIRHLLQHAVPTMIKKNPTEGIAQVKLPKSKGHHSWTDDEIARYRLYWKLGTHPAAGFRVRVGNGVSSWRGCEVWAATLLCRCRGQPPDQNRTHPRLGGCRHSGIGRIGGGD